jgi:hypothetical protein
MLRGQQTSLKLTLGLSNVHPEAGEVEGVELPVDDHGREYLALDRSGLGLSYD